METDEKPSKGLLSLFGKAEEGEEATELAVDEGDEGSAEDALSLEGGTESEGEESADGDDEGEEPESGSRAQKRIEALSSAKNRLERETVPGLQTQLAEAQSAIEDLTRQLGEVEAKAPDWFDQLYGEFADPENTARFDAALCGILDEKEFREDPAVKKVIDRAIGELKKRGFKMAQDAKPQEKKAKEEAPAAAAQQTEALDWTAKSMVETSVKDVLKRAGVRAELMGVIADAVAPSLLKESAKAKAMPTEKAIVDAVSAHVKAQGWGPEFYRAPKSESKEKARASTGGVGSAVVPTKKATAKDTSKEAKSEEPKTAAEADALRSGKLRSLFETLPAAERGAVA